MNAQGLDAQGKEDQVEKSDGGATSPLQHGVMCEGYLPAFDGKPILASCEHCTHCLDDSDGWEYGPAYYICDKKPHMSNLKGFPFKTAQKCCDLAIAFTADWDAIAKEEGYT